MTTNDARITLGDLRVLARTARWMLHGADQLRNEMAQGGIRIGSSAEIESQDDRFGAYTLEVLSYTDMLVAASFDQFDALLRLAEGAAAGNQTPTFAPLTIARSAVEMNATAHWLQTPQLGAENRAARYLSLQLADLKYQARVDPSTQSFVDEVEAEALGLGFKLVGRGERAGFESVMPSRSDRVRDITNDAATYVMMSSASHGAQWALVSLYSADEPVPTGDGRTLLLRKAPPVSGLYFALAMAMTTTATTLERDHGYRGWSLERLKAILQTAFNAAPTLQP